MTDIKTLDNNFLAKLHAILKFCAKKSFMHDSNLKNSFSFYILDAAIFMLQMKGIALLVTQSLLDWADYKPSSIPRKRTRGIEKRPSRIMSRSMSASTPKKKSYTRREYQASFSGAKSFKPNFLTIKGAKSRRELNSAMKVTDNNIIYMIYYLRFVV